MDRQASHGCLGESKILLAASYNRNWVRMGHMYQHLSRPVALHLSKALFSRGWKHCSVVRSFVLSTNHVRRAGGPKQTEPHPRVVVVSFGVFVDSVW